MLEQIEAEIAGINEVLQRCELRRITPLVKEVCQEHGVSPEEIAGRSRSILFNAARQDLWCRLYYTGSYSYPDIGWIFLRDHTTIISGIDRHERRVEKKRKAELTASPLCSAMCLEASCA